MENLLGIMIGVGLSAACGFRVFVPLLVMNLAILSGHLHPSPEFAWIGTPYATLAFTTATVAEIVGYYIPWFDSILDAIATPAAVIAGTVTTVSMVTDLSPFLKWTLAIIAGGGIAGLVQGSTVALRLKSSLATAGAGNPWIATLELAGAIIIAILAIVVPIFCIGLLGLLFFVMIRKTGRLLFGKRKFSPR
ncbi:protein of unknown function [Syntrophus gentianae]|uniref:DUF4126 domain-containing protein n=1 Tax=Syntrophus gentianae TaxID=43775 RepID=A0A1H7UAW5_9BACT|nr:DUF4126 domain-containing protein [Syntrophus gentianae]SEL94153.1 protein of unknown function [Syntrophus gentianae]